MRTSWGYGRRFDRRGDPANGRMDQAPIYYISATGSDANDGLTQATPWQTLAKVNATTFNPGESVLFKGGDSFSGQLIPTAPNPLVISTKRVTYGSYGVGRARLTHNADTEVVTILNISGITLSNLEIDGADIANGIYIGNDNVSGVAVQRDITVINCHVHDCTSTGIALGSDAGLNVWDNVLFENCTANDNNGTGIFTYAQGAGVKPMTNVIVRNCLVYNNARSGILMGGVTGGLIEYCEAYANGGVTTAGPIGIWMYDCASVTIRYCYSHDNIRGSATDGGGFDIDGGCTNCVMEYNYSEGNQGAGYLVYAYPASNITNAIVRFNVSVDDGTDTSHAYGGLSIGAKTVGGTITSVFAHNNVFRQTRANKAAVSIFNDGGTLTSIKVANNVLVSGASLLRVFGNPANAMFQGNSYSGGGNIIWNGVTYASVAAWQAALTTQEKVSAVNVAITANPLLSNANTPVMTPISGYNSEVLAGYRPFEGSPLIGGGINLATVLGLTKPANDFFGSGANAGYDVGLSFTFSPAVVVNPTVNIALTAHSASAGDLATYTFAAQNLGVASAGRKIVVGVAMRSGTIRTITSVTVGGIAASVVTSLIFSTSNLSVAALYIASVPAGTTGDVVVTLSAAAARCAVTVWALENAATVADTDSSIADPAAVTLTVPANGGVIGFAFGSDAATARTVTWAGLGEDVEAAFEVGNTYSGAHVESSPGGNIAMSADWNTLPSTGGAAIYASFAA